MKITNLRINCSICGGEFKVSQLDKSFSENWEKSKGYNTFNCPNCKKNLDLIIITDEEVYEQHIIKCEKEYNEWRNNK